MGINKNCQANSINICIDANVEILKLIEQTSAFCKVGLFTQESTVELRNILRKKGYIVNTDSLAAFETAHILVLHGDDCFISDLLCQIEKLDCKGKTLIIYPTCLPQIRLFNKADENAVFFIEQDVVDNTLSNSDNLIFEYSLQALTLFDLLCTGVDCTHLYNTAQRLDAVANRLLSYDQNIRQTANELVLLRHSISKIMQKQIFIMPPTVRSFLIVGYVWEVYSAFLNSYATIIDLVIPQAAAMADTQTVENILRNNLQQLKNAVSINKKNYKLLFSIVQKDKAFSKAYTELATYAKDEILSLAKSTSGLLSLVYIKGYLGE